MQNALLVGLGGFLGAIARYSLSSLALYWAGEGRFPFGTFTVNVLGCLLAGLLAGAAERYAVVSPEVRLLLFTGLLGGFTTFSAFGLEVMSLMRRGETGMAALYVGGSVVLGIAAVWLGLRLIAWLPR
ncbi:MAG: fluoride efflux transporter CrcB [Xanthomonadaceae bacterium]|nr:fluoride efflux transporter CrcB [Xanthomonadaceae bacterium]